MMPTDQPSGSSQIVRGWLAVDFHAAVIALFVGRQSGRAAPAVLARNVAWIGGTLMAAIDYEREYNNRARVPEHAEIFARWMREAEDYRTEAMKERRAELGLSYGSTQRQFLDLFSPPAIRKAPLALFIHGGYWRSLDPSLFSHMARGLNAHGVTVAVVGYNLCPQVSIADIIEEMRHALLFLWQRTGQRVMVFGHSAGGHLAAAMLATDWHGLYPRDAARSGSRRIFDLGRVRSFAARRRLHEPGSRIDETNAREVSPLLWPAPKGRTFDAAVGGLESSEFLRQSRAIVEGWRKDGGPTRDTTRLPAPTILR